MNYYKKFITYLYNNLNKVDRKIQRSDMLKDYYNNKYPSRPIYYNGRVMFGSKDRFRVDVRDFFTLNDETLVNIVKSLKVDTQTDNQKALSCLKYIIQNIPYKSDITNYGVNEFWEFPFEGLKKGSFDCEGGSILLANLLLISGIPEWKVRINAGFVFEPVSKRQVGHAYVTFFDEENEKWVILDWCFHPNIKKIKDREEYKKEAMYQDVWFSFNSTGSWGKNVDMRKDEVKNMKVFN